MSTTDYVVNGLLIALVIRQIRGKRLTAFGRSGRWPSSSGRATRTCTASPPPVTTGCKRPAMERRSRRPRGAQGTVQHESSFRDPEPLAEGGFVLHRFLVLLAVVAAALSIAGLAAAALVHFASKARRRRSSALPSRACGDDRARRAHDAARAGRVLRARDAVVLRPVRRPVRLLPGRGSAGWVFKVNGVSPPVGADQVVLKDGDSVLWYYAEFGPTGGPPTLAALESVDGLLPRDRPGRHGQEKVPAGLVFHIGTKIVPAPAGHVCPSGRTASSGRARPARFARTACRDPFGSSPSPPPAPCGLRRRRARPGDALGHARRGEDRAARRACAGGRDGDAGARPRREDRHALRRPLRRRRSTVCRARCRAATTGSTS